MRRSQVVLLAMLLVLAAGAAFLALRTRQPPLLPADDVHQRLEGAAACLVCHGPTGRVPRSPNHPLGADCLRCHGSAAAGAR